MAQVIAAKDALPEILSVAELAAYLGVPVSTIYFWRGRGEGPPGFKVGRQVRYRADDVSLWLEAARSSDESSEMREPGSGRAQGSRGDERAERTG